MIALITYQLPHCDDLVFESEWVTPTAGWNRAKALAAFQRQNPSARIQSFQDISKNYRSQP